MYCTCVLTAHTKSVLTQYIQYDIQSTKCPASSNAVIGLQTGAARNSGIVICSPAILLHFPLPFPAIGLASGPVRAASSCVNGCTRYLQSPSQAFRDGRLPRTSLPSHFPPP